MTLYFLVSRIAEILYEPIKLLVTFQAVADAQKENGHKPKGYIPGNTQYTVQQDGTVKCYTRMSPGPGYVCALAYSKNNNVANDLHKSNS